MKIANQLLELNKEAGITAQRREAQIKKAAKDRLVKIRRLALSKVQEYFDQCVEQAKNAAKGDPHCRSTVVRICNVGKEDERDCHVDAVKKVVSRLTKAGLTASYWKGANHGHHNCPEVFEYHFELFINLSW